MLQAAQPQLHRFVSLSFPEKGPEYVFKKMNFGISNLKSHFKNILKEQFIFLLFIKRPYLKLDFDLGFDQI